MMSGELSDRIWVHLGRDAGESKGRRRKVLNAVAQAYESGMCSDLRDDHGIS